MAVTDVHCLNFMMCPPQMAWFLECQEEVGKSGGAPERLAEGVPFCVVFEMAGLEPIIKKDIWCC